MAVRQVVLGLALTLTLAVAGVVVFARGDDHTEPARDRRTPATDDAKSRPEPPLGVFSRRTTGADALPRTPEGRRVRAQLTDEDRARVRHIELGGGATVHVWPASESICYDLSPVGGGCMPLTAIMRDGLDVAVLAEVSPSGQRYLSARVLGIVRDGIRSVRLAMRSGKLIHVRVHENAFYRGNLKAPPISVRWRGRGASHVVPVESLSPAEIASLR